MDIVYLNGKYVGADEALISPFDQGFLYGEGAFETMRVYGGRAVLVPRHYARLRCAARYLGVRFDCVEKGFCRRIQELMSHNNATDCVIRYTVSSGVVGGRISHPTEFAFIRDLPPSLTEMQSQGVSVILGSYNRTESGVSGHKLTSYVAHRQAYREAQKEGVYELIYYDKQNLIMEGTRSNVFCVVEGRLITPPADGSILPGIARGLILELASQHGFGVEQRKVSRDELMAAQEVFVSNAVIHCVPVVRVDTTDIGEGKPGQVTRQVQQWYDEYVML